MGIQKAVERLLVSPQFLFRIERDPPNIAPGTPYRISDVELASARLSFFLWSSIPDDELLKTAEQGQLKDPSVRLRLWSGACWPIRSRIAGNEFCRAVAVLARCRRQRTRRALVPRLRRRPALRLPGAKPNSSSTASCALGSQRARPADGKLHVCQWSDNDQALPASPTWKAAIFGGSSWPEGSVRRAAASWGRRSILTLTSYSTRTSPVLRGKWVLENLLNAAPPPPPANIPALKTEGKQAGETLSMRAAMTQHRAEPTCAGCQACANGSPSVSRWRISTAVGRWRDSDSNGLTPSTPQVCSRMARNSTGWPD